VTIRRDRYPDTPRLNTSDSLRSLQQPSRPRTTVLDRSDSLASNQSPFEGVSMRQSTDNRCLSFIPALKQCLRRHVRLTGSGCQYMQSSSQSFVGSGSYSTTIRSDTRTTPSFVKAGVLSCISLVLYSNNCLPVMPEYLMSVQELGVWSYMLMKLWRNQIRTY